MYVRTYMCTIYISLQYLYWVYCICYSYCVDPKLRSQFPTADGHLYEVEMERGGEQSFGMSICDKKDGNVMIASIAVNGVADGVGKIKVGDVIVKVCLCVCVCVCV